MIEYTCGRLRLARHLAIAMLGAIGAWAWFGSSGLVPVLLWAWQCRPRLGHIGHAFIGPVAVAQLGAFRTVIRGRPWGQVEVFRDELPPAALAALRRHLKAVCSARDGAEHVEPV